MEEILLKTTLTVDESDWIKLSSKEKVTFSMPADQEYHTQVPYEVITTNKDVHMFYIYTCVARWEAKEDGFFQCPYTRWAKLLKCSERTAKSKIKEAIEKKIIYVNRGNYLDDGSKQQEINLYHVKPIPLKSKTLASIAYERAESSKYIDGILGYDKTPLSKRKGMQEYAIEVELATKAFENMDKTLFPNDDHYYGVAVALRRNKTHLLAPEEYKLLDVAKRRMKILCSNPKIEAIVQEKMERAKDRVCKIKNTNILFVTYQDKIKQKPSKNHLNINAFAKATVEYDDPFGED